ncbi:hypothetical protein Asi02nite_69590 [Asanoa siamensis]|uniref:DDE family transposase n=1 Tax=Asanoa siamensis TaxID=926357 RepID=A0ABQ4D1M8_9ACTN|nr:hypothetical protein Asi02nite_69590 [Asanoa siamensis]
MTPLLRLRLLADVGAGGDPDDGGRHSVSIRRNTTTGELALYRCWTPRPVALAQLVHVAGVRWIVEESFQAAKRQVGLDQHQPRRWTSWHRFTTLAALAILAIRAAEPAPHDDTERPNLIRLTVNEIRRLINILLIRSTRSTAHRLRWSIWRRRHQANARQAHDNRRLNHEPQP